MMDLSKQVYPTDSTAAADIRVRNALHPRLKLAIGELSTSTPEYLIDRCQSVLQDLRAVDRSQGHYSRLPPMQPYANESRDYSKRQDTSKHYEKYHANQHNPAPNPVKAFGFEAKPANPFKQQGSMDTKGGYSNKKEFRQQTRGTYGRPPNVHAEKTCYQWKKPGHVARNCPSTAFFFNTDNIQEFVPSDGTDYTTTQNLNMNGGQ